MKVLLIQPSPSSNKKRIFPQLGLGYLASSLEQEGHKVKIVLSFTTKRENNVINKEISKFDPDVVGITSWTLNIYDALSISRIAKAINPNCLTILGGPHPTVRAKETLEICSDVDVVVRGEGEKTLIELLEKKKKKDFISVDGISFRLNGKIIENRDRKVITDIDSIPFPAYHLLPMEKYRTGGSIFRAIYYEKRGRSYSPILTSRGCPYGCAFCSSCILWGKKWRARSPENIIEEINLLRNKYGKKFIDILDDSFTVDKKRVLKLCRLIKEQDIDITWECTTRVDLFDKEIATALKNAGCHYLTFGVDTGVQKTLDILNKGHKVEDSIQAVKIAKNAGLKVESNFIIGIPGETKEMINTTISFAKKLDLDYKTFTILTPYPGTKIYELAEKNNLLVTKNWSKYELTNSVINVPGITSRELKGLLIKASLTNYFDPFKIVKSISQQLSSRGVDNEHPT